MMSLAQSIGKEVPFYLDNEDAYRADDASGIWAVADGAGGTGIYACEWAQHLIRQVPGAAFHQLDTLAHWLDAHWEVFFDTYRPKAQANYLTDHKFMEEGSSATLATLHNSSDKMHWMVYGDAVVLCFHSATGLLRAANQDVHQFATNPDLLNWLAPPISHGFRSGSWLHRPGQEYALVSDTLGQYILMAYEALQSDKTSLEYLAEQPTAVGNRAQAHLDYCINEQTCFDKSVWQPFRMALTSSDKFLAYTQQLRAQNLLGVDDYTGVLIMD